MYEHLIRVKFLIHKDIMHLSDQLNQIKCVSQQNVSILKYLKIMFPNVTNN